MAALRADALPPVGTTLHHMRGGRERFDVVHDGGPTEQALLRGERRLDAWPAALALDRLEQAGLLTNDELELVRKGRNRAGRGPRRGESGIYGRATGFETMVGWMFLRNPSRLAQLLDRLEDADP